MADKDLGQELENLEEGIENLKNKEFRIMGIKVTFMTASAAFAVLGSVIGTLYGGFLMYQKVEQAIAFVEQQTEYEEKISGFEQRMELMEKELSATKGSVQEATGYANEIKNDLKSDIRRLEGVVDSVERSSKQLQRETLADVKDMRNELRDTRKEVEREMKAQKADLEKKLKEAVDNPLAGK
jgi:DNA repair exonuclease SbcCD ATPase subunit